jgi:uroporphyrinogen decarboxylase
MRYGRPDRVPYFDDGIRDDVLEAWKSQGMRLHDLEALQTDQREEIQPVLEPNPQPKRWPTTVDDIATFKKLLDPDDPERLPDDWSQKVRSWRDSDDVLMLRIHRGFFLSLGVYGWGRLLEVVYLIKDDPAVIRRTLAEQAELSATIAARILSEVEIDAVVFTEPIGGNDRPLLSPTMYEDIVLRSYEPILSLCEKAEIGTVILRTYANARVLIPSLIDHGFNCLWACEVNVDEMDYLSLRREFGRDLRLIGGIDLDVLRQDRAAIKRELEERVPPLLENGGYVPLADGRVRADVPYENYFYYRELLKDLTSR